MQQRLHFPGNGTGSCRITRPAGHRLDDVGSSSNARRKFACPQRRFSILATSIDRPQKSRRGDRRGSWDRSTKDGVAAQIVEDELRERVVATQWAPAYAA